MQTRPADLIEGAKTLLSTRAEPLLQPFMAELETVGKERSIPPSDLPCVRWLNACVEAASPETRPLVAMFRDAAPDLQWGQTYSNADLPASFLDNYGWVELFGTRGHLVSERIAGGFLMLGPNTHYPDHHHIAEEIYVPLTQGTLWRKGDGVFIERAAGEVIHHPSNVNHAMRTAAAPLVAFYLWRGGPLAAKSTLT